MSDTATRHTSPEADVQNRDLAGWVSLLYGELHRLASRLMERQRSDHTLQPTALVHEACLKMIGGDKPWQDERHFLAVAAKAMRGVLVDHARARGAGKRGGGRPVLPLPPGEVPAPDATAVLDLHEALEALAEVDPQLAWLVELRCFGGLTVDETARVLRISPRSVKRGFAVARAWLRHRLSADDGRGA